MGESQNKNSRTLVLMGRTGHGKSATGNSILGSKAFKSVRSFSSTTKHCEIRSTNAKDGQLLNVIDTPGLFDPETSQEEVSKEIKKCIDLAKDGLHGVLLVLSLRNRFTPEEAAVTDCLQIIFGPEIMNYVVLVFTGADSLEEDDGTFQETLDSSPKQLKDLVRRCDNRVVLFNNKAKSSSEENKKQVAELLKKVDSIVAANGGRPYSNELFHKFQKLAKSLHGHEEQSGPQSGHTVKETAELLRQISETVENRVNKSVAVLQEQLALERAAHQNTLNEVKTLVEEVTKLRNEKEQRRREKEEGGICRIL